MTTTSVAEKVRQRSGIHRCIRRPSSRSSRHSATSATMVATIASTIAASFKAVGLVENRVSMTADSAQPRRRGPGQVGEDADDRRAQVRVGESGPLFLARRRIGEPDERGEGAGLRRGDLDALTFGRNDSRPAARWRPRRCGR